MSIIPYQQPRGTLSRLNQAQNFLNTYGPVIKAVGKKAREYYNNRQEAKPNKTKVRMRKRKQQPSTTTRTNTVYSAPVAQNKVIRSSEPKFLNRTARSTRIVHREFIGNISGTSAFTVLNGNTGFPLNPGFSGTFPWLSTQASSWEQYIFRRLRFCYYSRTGTSTPGSIMLAPDYDAADNAPNTEIVATSYRDSVAEVPWVVEFCCELDPKAMLGLAPRKYVRTAALTANLDIKTYDSGTMYVCTMDGTAVNWGKLWVEYDVELFIPQLPPTGVTLATSKHVTMTLPSTVNPWLGLTNNVVAGSNLALTTATGNILTFNTTGTFFIWYFGSATSFSFSSVVLTSASFITTFQTPNGFFQNINGSTFSFCALVAMSAGGSITMNLTITGGVIAEFIVMQVSSGQV